MKTNNRESLLKYEDVQKEENAGFSKTLFTYLRYWKWFVASIVVCMAVAVLYLKTASPVYEVNAKILLESTTDKSTALPDLGLFNMKNNTDNELEVLSTSYLMELTVRKLKLYTQYMKLEKFSKTELYGSDCPISVKLPETALNDLNEKINFEVEVRPNDTYVFTGNYQEKNFRIKATKNDSLVQLPFGLIYFSPGLYKPSALMRVGVTLENPSSVADRFLANMTISLASQTTTMVNLSLKTANLKKGTDFINTFIETYKEEDIKDQNMMANNTSEYLNNLLGSLGNELTDVEKQVENFKQREGITNVSSEAQLFIQRTGQYEEKRLDVGTQLGIIKDLETYINRDDNHNQLLPSGIGLQSANLNTLINEYNNLLLERKRLSRTATENNQVMIDLTDRTDALFRTVQSSISNEKRNLIISQQDLIQKDRENASRIKSIPRQEREISDLSRQQNIKSQLYLYLLQKRDESYLNTASLAPKFKIIGYPRSNGIPVSPESDVVLLLGFLCGFFIPYLGITFRNLLHYTVENKQELKEISSVPILGEIPKGEKSEYICIHEHSNDGITEMFRLLRTNLMFVLNEPWKKVINIVSSVSGEGKTVITLNLAISLALLEKKVLIICLDIRKPKMNEVLGFDNSSGVTQFLSGQIARTKLVRPSGVHPNLWVITTGPIPPNPNELLAKPALDELIEAYREQFDYIVIDTPPIGIVSDTLLLNRFTDVNLYVVRADYTPRKAILEANDLFNNQKLKNMYFVLNAADIHKASHYHYGYQKRYGYGYGYYSQDNKHKHKKEEIEVNKLKRSEVELTYK